MESVAYVGLDVHKDRVVSASVDGSGNVVETRILAPEIPKVKRYFAKLLSRCDEVQCCYEASGCGFVLQRALSKMGVACHVVAPSLIPVRVGDRVKTDRRDAKKLGELMRAGQLTYVRIPGEEEERVRCLVRCRHAHMKDLVRAKHRVVKFLALRGLVYTGTKKNWTKGHWTWLTSLRLMETDEVTFSFYLSDVTYLQEAVAKLDEKLAEVACRPEYERGVGALMSLHGVGVVAALTLVVEIGDVRRFGSAPELMKYVGLVPSEHSSGCVRRQGGITKTGSSRARAVLVEVAWQNARKIAARPRRRKPAGVASEEVRELAARARRRLHDKYWALAMKKERKVAVVATARELAGFVWGALRAAEG